MSKQKAKEQIKKASSKPYSATQPGASKPLIDPRYTGWILAGILVIFVAVIYFPVGFGGKAPVASDITQWQGAAKVLIDYNAENSDRALWTPNMFSGMPAYMISFPNRYPFLESLTRITDKVINWRIFLLIIGGLGIFLLLRQMKMNPWIAFFGSIAFIFSCHWVGLLDIGHNTKFRAIMYIPWVIWAMFRLREKANLLNLGLMAALLITQLRENHPQISYYLYLFVGMYWVFSLIEALRSKDTKAHWIFTGLMVLAFAFTVLAVLNPYLTTMEYSHYTMRGGGVGQGLEKSYAQAWSFHPLEIIGFIVPDFFGGINQSYWGYMPFTQIYNYFGLVVLALGVFAFFGKHKRMAIFLWISSALFTIMSFGEFAPFISDLLLKYLPYFNKFRVPSMILTMTQVIAVLLAALGIDTMIQKVGEKDAPAFSQKLFRAFWISGVVFVAWLLLARTVFSGLPFVNAATLAQLEQYNAMANLPTMQAERLALLYKSGILSLLFLTVSLGLAYLHSVKKLKSALFVVLLTVVVFIDLWIYTGKHLKDVHPRAQHDNRFVETDFDKYLLGDEDNFRIYPFNMNQIRPAGEWAYHHQSIDGYSAAKLKRYDDILRIVNGDPATQRQGEFIRHLLAIYDQTGENVSTPVLDMLSTKYVVMPDSLPMGQFLPQYRPVWRGARNVHIFRNAGALPKAWFVRETRHFENADSVYAVLREGAFDPRTTALVEDSAALVAAPDSLGTVKMNSFGLHEITYSVSTPQEAYLVLSEVYYPAGWKAYLGETEIPIYATNYILRGVKVPAGEHELRLVFAPDTYRMSLLGSLAGIILTLLAIGAGFLLERKRKPLEAQPLS